MSDPASPITHFEVYGRDPAALADFYEKLLGWRVAKAPGVDYWRIATGSDASIGGGITLRPAEIPNGWLCYARVSSLDQTIARALSLGVLAFATTILSLNYERTILNAFLLAVILLFVALILYAREVWLLRRLPIDRS